MVEARREGVVVIEVFVGIGVKLVGSETFVNIDGHVRAGGESPVLVVLTDTGMNRNSVYCDSDNSSRNSCRSISVVSSV